MNGNSGGRRNVPRPLHGDISCSGSGTRGIEQMLLDDHHIDDDDDEGVELTEPGVKPSNAIRLSLVNLEQHGNMLPRVKKGQMWLRFKEIKHAHHIRSTELFIHTHVMKGTKSLLQPPIIKRLGVANGLAEGNKAAMEERVARERVSRGKWASWVKQASRLRSIN
nr:hypothetical protein [Tanacetum cinerariifolium]